MNDARHYRVDTSRSLYDLVKRYPEVKSYLIGHGLSQVENPELLETIGKNISVNVLIQSKGLNKDQFVKELEDIIQETRQTADSTLLVKEVNVEATIKIQGVLPCPVRIPLLEGFESWLESQEEAFKHSVGYELKAASMGVDWIKEILLQDNSPEALADVFLSAGFDLFFDDNLMGHHKKEKVFENMLDFDHYNEDFDNETYSLIDPDGDYSVISAVPAIFLINKDVLGDREIPTTWEDLISGDFEGSVSLPVGDFDLFNAILLNFYKNFGVEGVRKLGKTLLRSMHPAEMVKSNTKPNQPVVTIMPFFFTKMVRESGPMVAVWPKDGAIISPIFMLSKRSKRQEVKPIVDFIGSKAVGEILSHNGRFPSTHPEVDNLMPKENTYMWLGWDFIKSHNIGALILECMELFNGGTR